MIIQLQSAFNPSLQKQMQMMMLLSPFASLCFLTQSELLHSSTHSLMAAALIITASSLILIVALIDAAD